MKKNSIILLGILFSINILSQNINKKDTFIDVPSDYENAVEAMMKDRILRRFVFDLCDGEASPVFYSDSVYIARLQKLPYRIEMPYNSIVRSFIDRYAKNIRQIDYMVGLGKSYYFPIFERVLAKYDLPLELKYLPIIESALNVRAVSHAGAGGLWQFIVPTGRDFGLEINSLVDERFDPVKSSEAAARYLKVLYGIYNDWHLVIAAYNCGPGNVARAMRRSSGKTDYWSIYPNLPRETRGYVPIFIAANYIMNYYSEHNSCPATPKFIQVTDTVSVTSRIHFEQISSVLNIPIDDIRFLNPQYRQDIIPGNIRTYKLVLPANKIPSYEQNLDSILAYKADALTAKQVTVEPSSNAAQSAGSGKITYYKVRNGDNLSAIASRHRVTVTQIKHWNGLNKNFIRVGQKLKIYR